MEKLEQLLSQHKDKLIEGAACVSITLSRAGMIEIDYMGGQKNMTISELLFNTPFLSWLEWKKGGSLWAERDNIDGLSIKTLFGGSSDYHKINLVLLSTDSERIAYLESNLL